MNKTRLKVVGIREGEWSFIEGPLLNPGEMLQWDGTELVAVRTPIYRASTSLKPPPLKTKIIGDLEWQEEVPDREFTWVMAKTYAASLGDGWRLPTIKELLTLVDYEKGQPACSVFPACPIDWFWSSSAVSGSRTNAWSVYFGGGNSTNGGVGNTHRVRCVRDVKGA